MASGSLAEFGVIERKGIENVGELVRMLDEDDEELLRSINYHQTLGLAIELSDKSWVLAAQAPGLPQTKAQRTIEPNKNSLLAAIDAAELVLRLSVTRSSA